MENNKNIHLLMILSCEFIFIYTISVLYVHKIIVKLVIYSTFIFILKLINLSFILLCNHL